MIARLVWAPKLIRQQDRCHIDLVTLTFWDPKYNLPKILSEARTTW